MARDTGDWASTKVMRGRTLRVVAHDPFPTNASGERLPLPANFVMGMGGATQTLLDLTPTGHVGRALDIGCGSGAQTLFLPAERIIATDIDARALEAANASCYLSGFRNLEPNVWRNGTSVVEFRQGSLLDPVPNQRFDLVVSNPPFIIEGAGHTHRDSPFHGDALTRELLTQLPSYLNAGGRAVLLASWLHPEGVDWTERLADWTSGVDASVWIAQREVLDIDDYVAVWSADAALPREQQLLWRARLNELGADGIGFGWIVIERSTSHWCHIEDVSAAARVPMGNEVEAQLRAFSRMPSALDLLHGRWSFVTDHWRGDLALGAFEAMLLEGVRSGVTLDEAISTVSSANPVDADDLLALGLSATRFLVELGYLVPATD